MLATKDIMNLSRVAKFARSRCNDTVEVAFNLERAMIDFSVNDPEAGLENLHNANAEISTVSDETLRIPMRNMVCELIERLEDSDLF